VLIPLFPPAPSHTNIKVIRKVIITSRKQRTEQFLGARDKECLFVSRGHLELFYASS
jgi:hypothetical protein